MKPRRSLASKALAQLRGLWKRRKEISARTARRSFFFEPLEQRSLLAGDLASHFAVQAEGEGGNTAPTFLTISDQTVLQGAPLWLGVDGADAESNPITYSITSSNPSVIAVTQPSATDKTLVLNVQNFGTMKFEMFDSLAPRATTQIESLANSGFYNNLTFHRILNDFVIQGGAADGSGGPNPAVPDFDDQFNPDLQFTSPGVMAMAKGLDDSNDTQFFVTDTVHPPTTDFPRHLDFNHTIFGKLTEGEAVREAISNVAVNSPAIGTPVTPVVITSATVLNHDPQNAAFMLKALASTGAADITVTATDSLGATFSRTFHVTAAADTSNGNPFLSDIAPVHGVGTATIQLQGNDVEGDAIYYDATKIGTVNYTVNVDHATGLVTVTPPTGFVGNFQVQVSAKPQFLKDTADANQTFTDVQKVTVNIDPAAPSGIDLLAASDTGASSTDNITNASSLQFTVSGITSGATVHLFDGNTDIAQVTASGTTADFTVSTASLSEGVHNYSASQTISGIDSTKSTALAVTYDVTPPGAFTSTAPTQATVGELLSYNAQNPGEGTTGFVYSLTTPPTGMAIDPSTGVVSWTPTAAQLGAQTFGIKATDAAGNSITQSVNLTVAQPVVKVAELVLSITDVNHNAISTLHVGDNFLLRGSTKDLRTDATGVYALWADLNYDPAKVQVTGAIQFNGQYTVGTSGTTTTAGLVDEVGAVSNSIAPIGSGNKVMFDIPMKVIASGQLMFTTDAADASPQHDTLLFNRNPIVAPAEIKYDSVSISVDTTFSAVNDTFTFNEDTSNDVLNVLTNDTIKPGSGNVLTVSAFGNTDHGGTVSISADSKSLKYTPAANFNGQETFTYTVKNQLNETSTATVTVNVSPVNDPPTASADTFSVPGESQNNSLNVLANDSSAPDAAETLKVSSVTQGNHGGHVTVGTGGTDVKYTPAANFEGTETFNYTINDGHGGSATATATVTVTHVNHNPVATADAITVAEDSSATNVNVLANDNTGIDTGETLTITAVGTPNHGGTVTRAADNKSVNYTPAANFQGTETFTYTISDGNNGTATGTSTVTVTNVNDPPTANADTLTGFKNIANVFDVLSNDTSAPDPTEAFTITAVTQPTHGTVSITNNGTRATYTPTPNYIGADSFTYTMQDPGGLTSTATANVTVQDFIPSKLSGKVFIDPNNNGRQESREVGVSNVEVKLTGTATGGQAVTLSTHTAADGSYAFENLAPGEYKLKQTQPVFLVDGRDHVGTQGGSLSANDEISIHLNQNTTGTGNNFAEVGKARTQTRLEEFFATNLANNVLVACTISPPAGGSPSTFGTPVSPTWQTTTGTQWAQFHDLKFALSGDARTLQIDATNASNQQVRSTISLSDRTRVLDLGQQSGQHLYRLVGSPARFNFQPIPASPINQTPVAAADTATVAEGASTTFNVAANDTDADGTIDLTSLAVTQNPAHGSVTVHNDGTLTYTHDGSETTSDSFQYTIKDNVGTVSNTATVSLTVTPVNDSPVAVNDVASLTQGGNTSISVASNDTDADGTINLTSIVVTQNPAHGTATVNANGTVTYTHDGSATASDSFRYTIKDGQGAVSNTATVSITLTPVNQAPVAVADTATLNEGATGTINLAANDTDADGTIDVTSLAIAVAPAHGSLTVNSNGTVTYTHDGSETTSDSFQYTIKDNLGLRSDPGTVSITINPVNDAPVPIFDTATLNEGASATINVAANDLDVDSALDLTSIVVTQNPAHGSVVVHNDGTVTYTHDGSETTSDTFQYTIKDAQGAVSVPASVLITVTPVNDPPAAADDVFNVTEDSGLQVTGNVLDNDSDPEGTALVVAAVAGQQAKVGVDVPGQFGTFHLNANGSLTYLLDNANPTVNGLNDLDEIIDSIAYDVADAQLTSSAFVHVHIHGHTG